MKVIYYINILDLTDKMASKNFLENNIHLILSFYITSAVALEYYDI